MNSDELDILLVEDNQDDMDLALHALQRGKVANRIFVVRDGEEALDFLFCPGGFSEPRPAVAARLEPKDAAAWTVELEPTTDVLAALGEHRRPGQLLVGFAADQGAQGLERARQKLTGKKADLLVFNDVARPDIGFDSADNEVTLIAAGGERTIAKTSKEEIAAGVLDEVERLLG